MNAQQIKELNQIFVDHEICSLTINMVEKFEEALIWAEDVYGKVAVVKIFDRIFRAQMPVDLPQNSFFAFFVACFVLGAIHKKHPVSDRDYKNIIEGMTYHLYVDEMLFGNFEQSKEYQNLITISKKLSLLGRKSVS